MRRPRSLQPPDGYMTIRDYCKLTRKTNGAVRDAVRNMRLPYIRIGTFYFVKRPEAKK